MRLAKAGLTAAQRAEVESIVRAELDMARREILAAWFEHKRAAEQVFAVDSEDDTVRVARLDGGLRLWVDKDSVTAVDADGDAVNSPSHYRATDDAGREYELIDILEAFGFTENLYRASALQYLFRAGRKDPEKAREDLEKAVWYVQRELGRSGAG